MPVKKSKSSALEELKNLSKATVKEALQDKPVFNENNRILTDYTVSQKTVGSIKTFKKEKQVQVSTRIPKEILDEFNEKFAKNGFTIAQVMRTLLIEKVRSER